MMNRDNDQEHRSKNQSKPRGGASCVTMKSPVGLIHIGYCRNSIVCVNVGDSSEKHVEEYLHRHHFTMGQEIQPFAAKIQQEFEEYFAKKRTRFTLKPHFIGTPFQVEVWQWLAQVPYGQLISYGELAALAGFPRAARAVGTAMSRNALPILIPCHRVIASSGKLGGFTGGLSRKQALLRLEGVDHFFQ